jgi:membrane protein
MLKIFLKAYDEWRHGRSAYYAASLTFYALFTLAPVIIIVIAGAGAIYGEQAARGELVGQIQNLVGPEIASAIEIIVKNAHISSSNILFTVLSLFIFLFAASRIVSSLKYALNKIWEREHARHKKVQHAIKSKFFSMLLVAGFGLLIVLLIFVSGVMATIWVYLSNFIPIGSSTFQVLNLLLSFGGITFIIASINKFLPDIQIAWKDVWIGAAVTTILFMLGNFLIGLYIRNVSINSIYGAAGSLVLILIWLYYSFQIFLFGAQFTKIYSQEQGSYRGIFKRILDLF